MATDILDLRRTDERNATLANPVWLESAVIDKDADDKAAILFSFPTSKAKAMVVHSIYVDIIEAFAGGTVTLDVGAHTLATDDVTTDGTATLVDADDYVPTADVTNGTIGIYFPDGGDFVTAKAAGTTALPQKIVNADTTVPCISAQLASSAAITAGAARVYALVSFLV